MRRVSVVTVTAICGAMLLGAVVFAPSHAEPAGAQAAPSSLTSSPAPPTAADAGGAPTAAPRPAQIEPMVAPVKRQAPPTPVLKTKPTPASKAVVKTAGAAKTARKPAARTAEKSDAATGAKKKR